ncbi:MAG TPA: cutinase family protein [Solirubrobacterales bacterium]|nr:cutinase family protein [Solirubrobacterales bacterium]
MLRIKANSHMLLASAIAVAGGLSCWAILGGAVNATAGPQCGSQVQVIAVRGSGETGNGSPGKTVGPFIKQLESLADPGAVHGEGLHYPAVGVVDWKAIFTTIKALQYKLSVDSGVKNLIQRVKQRAKDCGGAKLVLAGYSQGAHVIRDALPDLTSLASRIGAVVMFGDPHFDPHSGAAVKGGTYQSSRHGVLGLTDNDLPKVFLSHTATYCLDRDFICQGSGGGEAHKHYKPQWTQAAAQKVAEWLGLRKTRACAPASNIAAILDDSGSMENSDPLNIRSAAMQLLITKPGGQGRTLGAVEFGDEAGPLFAPEPISAGAGKMLSALGNLADDGYDGTGVQTNYNAAFGASAASQPGADARIFLTDGEHNVGDYENGHSGGPRTFVIGLDIGPSGQGDEAADLLGRIAAETGGAYYPLKLGPGDDATAQTQRLQPVFNSIDTELECQIAPTQTTRSLSVAGAPAKPSNGKFFGNPGVQVVVSWTTPGTQVGVVSASVRNPNGGLVANLTGNAPGRGHGKPRRIQRLQTSAIAGGTFQTVTIARPKHGSRIGVRVAAALLPAPTVVTIQISPIEALPAASETSGPAPTVPAAIPPATGTTSPASPPSPPAPPPPPTTWLEQETPNHPVNTFTNYHNASGLGPQIAAGQWVEVSCRVYDPTIASVNPDGYWYRIASPPWNNAYYSPANTFMNGDPYGGPYTHNTDFAVALC